MAFWVVRKGCVPDILPMEDHHYDEMRYHGSHITKRGSEESFEYEEPDHVFAKRARLEHGERRVTVIHNQQQYHDRQHHSHSCADHGAIIKPKITSHNPPFIVIREHPSSEDLATHHHHVPRSDIHFSDHHLPASEPMERTASGHSISSSDSPPPEEPPSLLSDFAAAKIVHKHLSTVNRHARHARILRTLVYPKTPVSSRDFTIDDDALQSIFSAANDLFFANKLRGRVTWDWSHPDMASSGRYEYAIVGTTALRKRKGPRGGGYETLIVLSSPILRDTKYNRRLLISTFLHEMIHSFLFIMCGRKAGINGGHTEGFRKIAADIDGWVGRECLRLTDMEADLERFTIDDHCHLGAPHGGSPSQNAVVFTELDSHRYHDQHRHHNLHDNHNHLYDTHHRQFETIGVSGKHYDEMETSPRYPSSQGHSYHQHDEWQWQQREGFGASRGVY